MYQFYSLINNKQENCYYVDTDLFLDEQEIKILIKILANGFIEKNISLTSKLNNKKIVEIGPRLNFATAWNTNTLSILRACGITKITRIEQSRRYVVPEGIDVKMFVKKHHDQMTECQYFAPLKTFKTNIIPEAVYTIPLIKEGAEVLRKLNKEMGFGMDEWDIVFYHNYFVNKEKETQPLLSLKI